MILLTVSSRSRYQPNSPWFDQSCREARRTARRLEKRFKRNGRIEDRSTWATSLRSMHILFKERECQYWEQKISSQTNNSKKLWKHLSSVLGRNKRSEDDSSPSFKPEAYLDFIGKKVKMVYDETSGAPQPTFRDTTHSFSDLRLCSKEDLEAIIKSSPAKSCDLDSIPTFLLKEFLDQLLLFILILCNKSLSTGTVPSSQKRAIVTPRLKKKGMDLSEPGSFRPISNLSFLSKILEKIVVGQLMPYLMKSDILPKFQSGYQSHHSTETAGSPVVGYTYRN